MKKLLYQNLLFAFCFFVIVFAVDLLFIIPNFSMTALAATAKSAGIKAVLLMVIMGILQAIYIRKNKISLAEFGINPNQSVVFVVDKSIAETKAIMESIIPKKISSSKFSYDKEHDLYKARTHASILSWGEMVGVKFKELGQSKIQLSVFSKPALRTTLVDFGKSAVNVQKIKTAFEKA